MCSFHQLPICGIHCLKLTNCKSFDQPAENKLSMTTLISNILLLFITLALERNKLTIIDSDYDLFRRHLSDDPVCSCGYICCSAETSKHFLCSNITKQTINKTDANERNINTLLFASDRLHLEANKNCFCSTPRYFVPV